MADLIVNRRELITGIDLIKKTCTLNECVEGLADRLDYQDEYVVSIRDTTYTNFEQHKEHVKLFRSYIESLATNINIVLTKAPSDHLDNGITDIVKLLPEKVTKTDIAADAQAVRILVSNIEPAIQDAEKREDLSSLKTSLAHAGACDIGAPDSNAIFNQSTINANRVNNALDSMSYTLRGINPYTGMLYYSQTVDQIKPKVADQIVGGFHFLKYVEAGTDKQSMFDILQAVEAQLKLARSLSELATIGGYIDSNNIKLILVRRAWAL